MFQGYYKVEYDDDEWEMVTLPDVSVRMLAPPPGTPSASHGRPLKRRVCRDLCQVGEGV